MKRLYAIVNPHKKILLVPRDSHKSVFDAVRLFNIDVILLPVEIEPNFEVSLGCVLDPLQQALNQHGSKVSFELKKFCL